MEENSHSCSGYVQINNSAWPFRIPVRYYICNTDGPGIREKKKHRNTGGLSIVVSVTPWPVQLVGLGSRILEPST